MCPGGRHRLVADRVDAAGLNAFNAAAIGLRHGGGGNVGEAREKVAVGCQRLAEHGGADEIDADPARQLAGGGADKAFQTGVDRRGIDP